jgi:hypothetical protein
VANVAVGYLLTVWVQVLMFALFGLEATLRKSLGSARSLPWSRSCGAS